jgi:hypothetical protein
MDWGIRCDEDDNIFLECRELSLHKRTNDHVSLVVGWMLGIDRDAVFSFDDSAEHLREEFAKAAASTTLPKRRLGV